MNKTFALVITCAVSVLGLASCNNKEADVLKSNDKTHTVVFQAQNPAASETKTALQLNVVPDWRETDPNDVHIFETETIGETVTTTEATRVTMDVNEDYSDARFTAEFENAEVIADPQETKAASSSTFQYTAIMATRVDDKYVVPSVQYPNKDTWIDPKADMLVGRNQNTYSETLHEKEVDLHFERPVSLARLAITNLEGTKVNMVKLTTANNITGYLTYNEINFDKKEQTFQSDDSNKELTIVYPTGREMASTFYAYFVSVPGIIQFSKIEVYTDQFVFTKTYASPAELKLGAGRFMNIALDMTPDKNGVTRTGLGEQTLSFVDGDSQPVTEAEYDLYSANPFVAPTLVIGDNVVDPTKVEVSSDKEEVAIASYANDVVSVSFPGKTGVATITATVPGDETHAAGTASFKLTVVDSTPKTAQEIAFAEEAVDYDLYGGTGKLTLPAWAENKDPKTTVTYASNSEVITVDETSGEVTIGATAKVGDTAVITATAAEDDTYQEATATCTITVVDTTPVEETTYMLVTKVDDVVDGNYVIISHDDTKIYDGSETHLGGYKAVPSEGVSINTTAKTITLANSNKATMEFAIERTDNTLKIKRGETYMALSTSNQQAFIAFNATGTAFTFDPEYNILKNEPAIFFYGLKSQSKEYLYYKPKDNGTSLSDAFKIGNSGKSYGVHLYFAGERTAPTLSFDDFTYDLNPSVNWGTNGAPVVTGLTVSSSNKNVVDYVSGEWVFGSEAVADATATITVTYPASATELSATTTFKVTIADTRTTQSGLSFTKNSVTITADSYELSSDEYVMPEVAGSAEGSTVVWSVSNSFAKIANNKVVPQAAGEVSVTATVSNPAFLDTQISYTLTITGTPVVTPHYYQKVTATSELVENGIYLIVNEENDKLFKPVLNDGNTQFKQTSDNAITAGASNGLIAGSDEVDACQIVLKNKDGNSAKFAMWVPSVGYYLMVYGTSNNVAFAADQTDDGYRCTYSISSGVASIYRDNTHYLRYSGSSSCFQSGSNANNIAIYKYVEGTMPTPTTTTYNQISTHENLESGTYLVVSASRNWVYQGTGSSNNYKESVSSTSGNFSRSSDKKTITYNGFNASDYEFVVTRTGDVVTLHNAEKGYIYFNRSSTNGNYISVGETIPSGANYNGEFTINKNYDTSATDFKADPDVVFLYVEYTDTSNKTSKEYLYSKDSQNEFKIGGSGAPEKETGGVLLYKKN